MLDQQLVVIQPSPGKLQQLLLVAEPGDRITHHTNKGAALVLCHPVKPECLLGHLLMVKKSSSPAVHGSEGCNFRRSHAEFFAQMGPKGGGDHANRFQRASAQAQKSHVQCQAQLVFRAIAGVNYSPFRSAESEKGLQLKGAELARKVGMPMEAYSAFRIPGRLIQAAGSLSLINRV